MAHTPGPWRSEAGATTGRRVVARAATKARQNVAHVGGPDRDANARLIAAAPELLEALAAAEDHFGPFAEIEINGERDPDDMRVVAMIRAAISKAMGEPA